MQLERLLLPDHIIIAAEARRYWETKYGKFTDLDDDAECEKCARCGVWGWCDENADGTYRGVFNRVYIRGAVNWSDLWEGKQRPDVVHDSYCDACVIALIPWMHRLHDITELISVVNKLERAIHGKRKEQSDQDNGAASDNSRKRGQGRVERRP